MAFGCILILYAAVRMLIARKAKPVKWNPEIQGLQMFPTIRTWRSISNRSVRSDN